MTANEQVLVALRSANVHVAAIGVVDLLNKASIFKVFQSTVDCYQTKMGKGFTAFIKNLHRLQGMIAMYHYVYYSRSLLGRPMTMLRKRF